MDELTTGEALLGLTTRLYRLQIEALQALNPPLSLRQYRILDRVDRHITTMTELAEQARRRLPTISKSAESLVRQGLLTRENSPTDRRSISLVLTPTGRELLEQARASLRNLSLWIGSNLQSDAPLSAELFDDLYGKTETRLSTLVDDLPLDPHQS